MGSGAVKTIVLLMVLVVLSFLVGAQVSDDMKDSIGAFAMIAVVAVGFVVLLLGRESWSLLLILPTLSLNVPLGTAGYAGEKAVPIGFILAAGVLILGVVMSSMGYIRFKWRSILPLDFLILLMFCYMMVNFLRFPTSLSFLSIFIDSDYVGGKEYVWCLMASIYYVAVSCMVPSMKSLSRGLRWSFWLLIVSQIIYAAWRIKMYGIEYVHAHGNLLFRNLTPAVVFFIYASLPFRSLLLAFKKQVLALGCLYGSLLNGGRESLLYVGSGCAVLALVKKEFFVMLSCVGVCYVGLYTLGSFDSLSFLPDGAQRVVVSIPGVPDPHNMGSSARATSETRYRLWNAVLDSRTGYIKDYVFGDGFRISAQVINRMQIGALRNSSSLDSKAFEESLLISGSFHNGFLTTIHRVGAVGCVVVYSIFLYGLFLLVKFGLSYHKHSDFPYMMAFTVPFASTALTYSVGTQTMIHFFACFQFLALVKILYCFAREEGRLTSLIGRTAYVPLMIREIR